MSEIDDLFALARQAATPPAGAKERVLSRVLASVPPPGGSAGGGGGGAGAAAAPLPALTGGGAALAGALVFALAALLGGGIFLARTQRAPEAEPIAEITSPVVTTSVPVVTPPPASTPTEIVDLDSPRPAARPAPSVATDSLAEELALIRSAQSALASGNANAALSILDRHAQRFPRGKLGQEREVTRVRALCRVGRIGQAQSLYRALAKGAPSSPHLASLRASCPGLAED